MKLIVANTKMYLNTIKEINNYQEKMENYKNYFVVAPQNIYLENFIKKGFSVASQNTSNKEKGPYTGEISPKSLNDLKVKYTLIGHSEIRKKYKEEKYYIKEKIKKSIENNLDVILCVGEKEEKKDKVYEVLEKQLNDITPNENLIISYEPVWAIGGDKILEEEKLKKIIKFIKNKGYKKVLYGGSINENNIEKLNKINIIDGFLIGRSSVNPSSLKRIIEVVK